MKRLSVIALLAASFAFTACKKENKDNKPATTETKPADVKPADVKPADVKPADVKPADPTAGGTAVAPDPTAVGTAPAGSGDAEFDALMGKMVGMLNAMGTAIDAAGGDCGKVAEGMDKVMADNKDFIEKMKGMKGDPAMEKKGQEWAKGHMAELMGPGMKIAEVSQKCASDAKFMEAMKKMQSLQ